MIRHSSKNYSTHTQKN